MLIRLEDDGKIIQETRSEALAEELIVGRSRECQWCVASSDGSVGRQHISLTRKGRHIVVCDLESRNGTFVGSKRIKSVKLRPDMEVRFGPYIIRGVEVTGDGEDDTAPRLHVTSGRARGTECKMSEGDFLIGSDPGASLVLIDDLLISREHAKIIFKDGGYWIHDCGSSNGTKVNGVLLRGEKERLLQDNDRVEIAHVEMSYREQEGGRHSIWILVRLGVILATLLIAAVAYKTFRVLAPSAKDHYANARGLAAEGQFDAARDQLTKAETASGSDRVELSIQSLRNSLQQWERTQEIWYGAVDALEDEEWIVAARELAKAVSAPQNAWNWDPSGAGIDLRNEAKLSKRAVDAYLAVDRLQAQRDVEVEEVKSALERLAAVQVELTSEHPDYLKPLLVKLSDGQSKASVLLSDFAGLDNAFTRLKQWPPSIGETISRLEKIEKESQHERLRTKAKEFLRPLQTLSTALTSYNEMIAMVHTMDFQAALAVSPEIPTPDDCLHDDITQASRLIKGRFEKSRILIVGLAGIMNDVQQQEKIAGDAFMAGRHWRNAEVMGRIMGCDSLNSRYPKRTRAQPLGDYDRYLSIESFYQFLRSKGTSARGEATSDAGFTPVIVETYLVGQQYRRIVNFMSEDKRWIVDGPLEEALARANAFLSARDTFVSEMLKQAETGKGREAVIAAGIALWLSENPSELEAGGKRLDDWLSQALRVLRSDLSAKAGKYEFADPDEKIALRKVILTGGVPGDAIVKRMWIARSSVE